MQLGALVPTDRSAAPWEVDESLKSTVRNLREQTLVRIPRRLGFVSQSIL
jgi:hypothetical protein